MDIKDTNIIGIRYCRLVIQEEVQRKTGGRQVIARCDCGVVKQFYLSALAGSRTKSCGCLNIEARANRVIHSNTVGHKFSGAYGSWAAMKQRCLDPCAINYATYGGAGITIASAWLTFENFLSDMGPRPATSSLDRIDPAGNYEPSNCRWATDRQQQNNRTNNRTLVWAGVELTIAEWSRKTGIEGSLIRKRIDALNWTVEKALTTTLDARRRQ